MTGQGAETKGVEGILGKHSWWEAAHVIHAASAEGPFLHGEDRFAVIFDMDVKNRETRERMQMREVAVYCVAGGRIVREEFFYGA